jgi:hypothetical protein
MMKFQFGLILALSAVIHAPSSMAADLGAPEQAINQAMVEAIWPADMAKAAAQYEAAYPHGAQIEEAHALRRKAEASMLRLMRSDIMVYRSTVMDAASDKAQAPLVRLAMLGDGDAALKLAHQAAKPASGRYAASGRYVGWLQWATSVGNEKAAYELALHFRAQGQPLYASQYEAKAVALGYVPPPVLDHSRR